MKAKKFCIIALVLALVLLIAPISESLAEEEAKIHFLGYYDYILLDDGTAYIFRYNGKDEKVIVPEKLDGIRVTCIGDGAFSFCDNLKEITIPDSVENIGENPFMKCNNLSNINITANHPTLEFVDNALIYKPEKKMVSYICSSYESKYEIPDGIESIGKKAFSMCFYLTEIKIPNSVQSIDKDAFSDCSNLTEINIPNSVKSIENNAFMGCRNIKEINLPDSLQSIGNYAFFGCINIKEIKIPDSVENIGANPFYGCDNLLNIEISDNHPTLEFIDNALIYKLEKRIVSYLCASKESKYEIPEGIETIGDSAFVWCENLTEVKIPESVQLIGYEAFYRCFNITKINIPDGVQSIGGYAFGDCYNITEIKIPDGVKSIGDKAFSWCKNLEKINIPNSVENIGANALNGCYKLKNIDISADHPTLAFVDNVLIYKPEKKILTYLSTSKESKYEIPYGIESIGENAFSDCTNLKKIKIPDSVQSIGIIAFNSCSNLKRINIPASVKYIGEDAFYGSYDHLTIIVKKGSYAEEYCKENNLKYKIK